MDAHLPGDSTARRLRICIQGVVQGVGFRPYVHRLAGAYALAGHVRNDAYGVTVEVEGASALLDAFLARLPEEAPPLAALEHLSVEELAPRGECGFSILESDGTGPGSALVPPDVATCAPCLSELFDPRGRRYRYPFINCTDCGPRFTIIRATPYDRPLTTMAGFAMCARCRAEYRDAADRRFHAEPNACPVCGPRVWLADGEGGEIEPGAGRDAVAEAATLLRAGATLALKGVGGFHLACLARDEEAVRALRRRKRREGKPFALMVPDLGVARRLVRLGALEERLLTGHERPIVLARRRATAEVAPSVAPGVPDLGLMLPYSPLHHLLLADVGEALVMTSGNRSDEPIAFQNEEALDRLAGLADLFLLHDRPIHLPVDDSVVRAVTIGGKRRPLMVRRSRGYAPSPLMLPIPAPRPLLAAGAQLKNTFCLVDGERAWVGPHVGDLSEVETLRAFERATAHLERLYAVAPETIARDLHPDYRSSRYAESRLECEPVAVQHHHAHLAACLAEHGERGPAIGVIYDGSGYAPDGTIWGGELLLGDLEGYTRAGHLRPVRLPGGEAAIREPWRMACAWLAEALGDVPPLPPRLRGQIDPERWESVARMARSALPSPVTTSMGRLFDAVAALAGLAPCARFEGEGALALEAAYETGVAGRYPFPIDAIPTEEEGGEGEHPAGEDLILDPRPLIRAVAAELEGGASVGRISARFHRTLADATLRAVLRIAARTGVWTAVLSGGVFQNVRLLERTAGRLAHAGVRVLVPSRLPPNDGGIAYGQAAIAAARGAMLVGGAPRQPGGAPA